MAEVLTLTTIPQEKFERFARYSHVPAATSLDLSYTKITDEQRRKHHARPMVKYLNTGKQSNVPDFYRQKKARGSIASDRESVSSANTAILRISTETRDQGTCSVDKVHYFRQYPGDRTLLTVVKCQKPDGDIDHKRNWSEVRYTIPRPDHAVGDSRCNTSLATGNATEKTFRRISEMGKTNGESDKSDFQEEMPIASDKVKEDMKNNTLPCANLTNFENIAPSFDGIYKRYAMKPPMVLKRNTRHGGDRKITAYRPCTSLDTFRRNWLDATERAQPHCPDVNEANNIWAEVDKMIENSKHRRLRVYEHFHEKPLTANTMSERKRCEQDRLAIELRPCFKNMDSTKSVDTSKPKQELEYDKPDFGNSSLSKKEDGPRYDWIVEAVGSNDKGKLVFGEENGLNKHKSSDSHSNATDQNAGVVWVSPKSGLDSIPSKNHRYSLNGLRNCEEHNSWSLERVGQILYGKIVVTFTRVVST